jgi:hypothetical protein
MAKSVNKVILVGNVGQDPQVRYTASGVPVAKLSRAADHSPRTTRNFLERRLWTGGYGGSTTHIQILPQTSFTTHPSTSSR